jgi:hypothetical protein
MGVVNVNPNTRQPFKNKGQQKQRNVNDNEDQQGKKISHAINSFSFGNYIITHIHSNVNR